MPWNFLFQGDCTISGKKKKKQVAGVGTLISTSTQNIGWTQALACLLCFLQNLLDVMKRSGHCPIQYPKAILPGKNYFQIIGSSIAKAMNRGEDYKDNMQNLQVVFFLPPSEKQGMQKNRSSVLMCKSVGCFFFFKSKQFKWDVQISALTQRDYTVK